MIRRPPRWLRWVLWLAVPLLVIYFTLNVVLTSTAFSRFVLNRVEGFMPELQFSQVRGNFTRGLNFDLRYEGPGIEVLADGATLQLGLECLWQMSVCIRRVHADQLRLTLLEAAEDEADDSDQGLELPEINLPLDIRLYSLTVGHFQIWQQQELLYELEEFNAALAWQGSTLSVEQLFANDSWCRWALEGDVNFIGDYPLNINLACESIEGLGDAVADISGDLENLQVQLTTHLSSPYTAQPAIVTAALSIALLDEELPVTAAVEIDRPLTLQLSETTVELFAAQLNIDGPLLSPGIDADLSFESPYWPGTNQLSIKARANTQQLELDSLLLELPEGELSVAGQLDYSEALQWQGQVQWEDLALEQFAEGLSGRLAGQIDTELDYRDDDLRAALSMTSISGTVLNWSFAASGDFNYADEVLHVDDLDVQQGDNHIQLAGDLALRDPSSLQLKLDLPQLRQMIPEQWLARFEGAVQGEFAISGTLEQPTLKGDLVVNALQYEDMHLQRGELAVDWQGASESGNNFTLQLEQLTVAEGIVGQLHATGRGGQAAHTFEVTAEGLQQHEDKRLALRCRGGFAGTVVEPWQGECDKLDLDFRLTNDQQWRLQDPIEIAIDSQAPEVNVSAFCLSYQDASLCSRSAIQFQDDSLSPIIVVGDAFSADWFQGFLGTDDLQLGGHWGFQFTATDALASEPGLMASVSSADLSLVWSGGDGPTPLALETRELGLVWQLAQQRHVINWAIETVSSGSTHGEVSLANDDIAGQLTINGVELADYGHLFLPSPSDDVAGQVNANLILGGSLQLPVLDGELTLSDGLFRTDVLPVPLQDINLQLAIRDNNARAEGAFHAAESQGRLEGDFVWEDESWSGNMSIVTDPLLVQPEPQMRIYVAPDLRFAFQPNRISISGKVGIPRAEVEITELPEQAVSISSDTVIVGAQETVAGTPLEVLTNIELVLGDRVLFEGFGLETYITGNLRLQQRSGEVMRANGRLSLVEGRYTAYAQNLVIRSGDLVFVGDIDNPQLRVEAIRGDTPEDVTVGLRASGSARNPRISLFSQPDMPQQAQLRYLVTGNPPGVSSDIDPQMAAAEAALGFALESSIGTGITRRAGDALGIEDLQVTTGTTDSGTQIGLSGYVTPNLLVRYGVGVFDAINTWTLRYQVSRSVYLEAISGESSDIGIMWSFERD